MKDVIFDFSGKNFIVVGASSGLGRTIASELAEAGACVLAVARNRERLERLHHAAQGTIDIACLDVVLSRKEEWEKIFSDFSLRHGKLNGGIYTAGVTGCTPLRAYDEKTANDIMDINLKGAVRFVQYASKRKYAAQGSSYVVFSSVAAYEGSKGILFYAAAKGAVQSAVRVMAKEILSYGHRINSISPAWIQTEMTDSYLENVGMGNQEIHTGPLGLGTPQDVSGMALFLLSSRAKWITGQDFVVDGGYLYGK